MRDGPRFIDVQLEPCEAAPDGLTLRFKAAPGGDGEPRAVAVVPYESESGVDGRWRVYAVATDEEDAPRAAAHASLVEDSSDGTAWLVFGGEAGLLLEHEGSAARVREAYLLLAKGTTLA